MIGRIPGSGIGSVNEAARTRRMSLYRYRSHSRHTPYQQRNGQPPNQPGPPPICVNLFGIRGFLDGGEIVWRIGTFWCRFFRPIGVS